MPNYIKQALHKFKHTLALKPENALHKWNQPKYGAKQQLSNTKDDIPVLPPSYITHIHTVVATLLYYAILVDNTMLIALSNLMFLQKKGTQNNLDALTQFLNYAATHPNATVRFRRSGMILHIHSDGSYLLAPKARSCAGGHFFLSSNTTKCPLNGPVHVIEKILRNVMGSTAETEVGDSYINGQEAIPLRQALEDMGHTQPPTPMQVDNNFAVVFASGTTKEKISKAIDMRFYWTQDRAKQGQFIIYWLP